MYNRGLAAYRLRAHLWNRTLSLFRMFHGMGVETWSDAIGAKHGDVGLGEVHADRVEGLVF